MKNQALFSLKDKSKILKCRLLQFLFGALRVNWIAAAYGYYFHVTQDLKCGNYQDMAAIKAGHTCPFKPKYILKVIV